jgi:ADP-ribose pyrophosphatase YjhB (NUDIX family)
MTDDKKGWLDEELYQRAIRALPIVCVDLVVSRSKDRGGDEILMVLRKNEPLAGHWWFPGGRVLLGEARLETAKRKLKQECGLSAGGDAKYLQRRTHDIVVPRSDGSICHSLTTVFWVEVEPVRSAVILDAQSARFEWRTPRDWLTDETITLHPWLQHRLREWTAE